MARNSILVIAMLFCMALAKGQDLKVEVSPAFKAPMRQIFQNHLYSDASGHYLFFYRYSSWLSIKPGGRTSVVFEKYDPRFKLIYSKDLEEIAPKSHSAGVVFMKDQFVWIRTERSESDEQVEVRLTGISTDGELSPPVLVVKDRFEGKVDLPETKWAISNDTSKLLLATYSDKNQSESKLKMILTVTDPQLKTVWQNQFELPYSEKQLGIQSWCIDHAGNIFMISKVYDDDKVKEAKREEGERVVAYRMVVFKFEAGADHALETELDLGGAFVKNAQMALSPKGDIQIVGLFSNDFKGLIQGLFFIRINPLTSAILLSNKKSLSEEELNKIGYKNIDLKKGELGLVNTFEFGDLLFLEDGSSFVTVEKVDTITTTSDFGDGNVSSSTTYRSGDIIVLRFDADGAHKDIHVIPKHQTNSAQLPLGHVAFAGKDRVYFFYNENKKNLKKPLGEKPAATYNFTTSIGVLTSIDAAGKIERKPLIAARDIQLPLAPRLCGPIGNNSLFFIAIERAYGQRFRVGRVLLPDWGE